jgi:DNA-directed RNA polymerase specialized sigma24 family protein
MVTGVRHTFDEEFQALLTPGSSCAHSMLAFVSRSLAQFNLQDSYTPTWILNEAYIRRVKQITTGETIVNPLAWVRATAYNIIREESRKNKRLVSLEENVIESHFNNNTIILEEEIDENFERVKFAFNRLEPEEKQILNLKIIRGFSWKEIVQYLILEGREVPNEATLRKRKERALKNLRQIYHSLQLQNS